MALQINDRIGHQLPRQMVRHFTAAVEPMQGWWILRIEMQMVEAGAAARGVTSRVLQQQQQFRATAAQQTLLPLRCQRQASSKEISLARAQRNASGTARFMLPLIH